MEWKTISITPDSSADREFLERYPQQREKFLTDLNKERRQRLFNEEPIFKLDFDLVASNEYNIDCNELFFRDILQLLRENGCQWKKDLIKIGVNPDVNNTLESYREHLPEETTSKHLPEIGNQGFHIDSLSKTIHLHPTSNSQAEYVYEIDSLKNVDTREVVSIQLDPDSQKVRLYLESEEPSESVKHKQISARVYLEFLSVSHGTASFAQVTVPISETKTIQDLADTLNVRLMETGINGTYFIIGDTRKYTQAKQFLETNNSSRTLDQYYSLFGFPVNSTEHIQTQTPKKTIVNLAGEEFFVYALWNNKITQELASYATYIRFRPEPTMKGIKEALKYTKNYEVSLEETTKLITSVQQSSTEELYNLYQNDQKSVSPWPVLPVSKSLL